MQKEIKSFECLKSELLEKLRLRGCTMNILVKGNHLSGELETVCPGRRKPVYMRRSRCPEDARL